MSGRGLLSALALACGLAGGGVARAERVTDPNAINRYDVRVDVGLASPVGMVGGSLSVPWRMAAVEGSLGWGLTGLQLSAMPKLIPLRWDRSALLLGVGATIAVPTAPLSHLGEKRTWFQNAEIAYQRAVFIDSLVYVALGVTRGKLYPMEGEGSVLPGDTVYWPMLRVGYGRRR